MSVIFAPILSFFQRLIDKEVRKHLRKMVFTFSAVIFLLLGVVFVSSGLVEGIYNEEGDKRTKVHYQITEKGDNMLRYFNRAKDLLKVEKAPLLVRARTTYTAQK